MRVICPKCELKGQVDAAPKGAKTRIACVRCATTFDANFLDGEIQALPPQASHVEATVSSAVGEIHVASDVSANGAEFGFTPELLEENESDASREIELLHAPLDDFSTSSADLAFGAFAETTHAAPQEISQEFVPQQQQDTSRELRPQIVETEADEADGGVEENSVATAQALKALGTGKVSRPPVDAYGMGVRLMRVSPLWLLLVGLSFISFIVFCNWLIKPEGQPGEATQLIAAANNGASNRAARGVNVPTSSAQSAVNSQAAQPVNESGAEFIKTEAKAAPPVAAPSVEPAGAKPAVEEKPAVAASSSERTGATKEGKVTIQVGSYNAAAEAEQRVANLKSAGYEARSVAVEIPKRGTWYRVQSGRFVSRDEAERYGKQLRDKGVVSSFITTGVQE